MQLPTGKEYDGKRNEYLFPLAIIFLIVSEISTFTLSSSSLKSFLEWINISKFDLVQEAKKTKFWVWKYEDQTLAWYDFANIVQFCNTC